MWEDYRIRQINIDRWEPNLSVVQELYMIVCDT